MTDGDVRSKSVEARCRCGLVRLSIAYPPVEITECNCLLYRRYGVLWAYYALRDVEPPAASLTETYLWNDRSIAFHRCVKCGCVTHWSAVDPTRDRLGMNARLLPSEATCAATVVLLDGNHRTISCHRG